MPLFFCCTAPVTSVMIVSAALGELILPLVVGQVSVRSTPLSHLTPTTTRVILVLNCSSCFSVGLRFHKSSLVNQQQQEIRRGNMWILVPRWGGKFFLSDNHAFSIILNINLFKTVGERRYRLWDCMKDYLYIDSKLSEPSALIWTLMSSGFRFN